VSDLNVRDFFFYTFQKTPSTFLPFGSTSAYSIHLWFLAHMVSGAYEKMSWKLQNLSIEIFFARENQKFKMATETGSN
jgi:hypothetical protein